MRYIKQLYLTGRFFGVFAAFVLLFGISFGFNWLFPLIQLFLVVAIVVFLFDLILLYNNSVQIGAKRTTQFVLSLGSQNDIIIEVENKSPYTFECNLVDEIPIQFQMRNFTYDFNILSNDHKIITYQLRPTSRGVYSFGKIHVYIKSKLGLGMRRMTIDAELDIDVYPSIIEMKQFELRALPKILANTGLKKIRRIGQSYEFEQIKNYVAGDDFRNINWSATGRRSSLMVNQYEDEKSQPIYSLIDNSRSMLMPFNGLSLLDYAVNSSLVISNVALGKHDKAGLLTFSNKPNTGLRAEKGAKQLNRIILQLYNIIENPLEANYELMYVQLRNLIKSRSLIFLYTNFESRYALQRSLPVIRQIAASHLLVVVIFENTEIYKFLEKDAENVEGIYEQSIAQKFMDEKVQIATELQLAGIQTIITKPEDLTVNTVNKYLELKARGMI